MWAYDRVFYQIYPLGLCGAPERNDGVPSPRIRQLLDWVPHLRKLGVGGVYFSPLFESEAHGYDARDLRVLDTRLGSNEDFQAVCEALHGADIKVVLDGVFHHVGRGFWAFQDVVKNRESSPYLDWFFINLGGNSCYNDGLWYEGWEGHYDLVKLNLHNEAVVNYIFESIRLWVDLFQIDGLRLDVAYCLEDDFLRRLRGFCDSLKPDFFLLGEMIHGDYNRLLNCGLNSVTNYECYKGLHSSFNSKNLFEICHSLQRQFGAENWCIYRDTHLWSFVDNHDVSRISSQLEDARQLPQIYALMFGMPGIPCVYYGSEWGLAGRKSDGDAALRVACQKPEWTELTDAIAQLVKAKTQSPALRYGSFKNVSLTNQQCVFERQAEGERVLVAVNMSDSGFDACHDSYRGPAVNLLTGETAQLEGKLYLPPLSAAYWSLR